MSNIIQIINELHDFLPLGPATEIEISDAEIQLCIQFANDYKEYLTEFGAVIADGIELTGIAKSEHRNVVSVTVKERELNSNVPLNLYVIENIGIDGIIIWQDKKGDIYQTTPNNVPKKIAESLSDYLKNR